MELGVSNSVLLRGLLKLATAQVPGLNSLGSRRFSEWSFVHREYKEDLWKCLHTL